MNKRIVELREQAFSECKRYDDDCGDNLVKTNEVFDKFAELIIRETLQVARAGIQFGPSMEEAVYTYFGVEE